MHIFTVSGSLTLNFRAGQDDFQFADGNHFCIGMQCR